MPEIDTGAKAPDFTWTATDGKSYSLSQALQESHGPMLAAFFKVSCPTCQFTFPFLERVARYFPGRVWGVSQDDARSTRDFAKQYGVTFPLLLEDTDDYPTSNAYGLTYVPSIFLIGAGGEILESSVGFGRKDLLKMTAMLGELIKKPGFTLFRDGEDVPSSKAG
jgi:peroxiredoxin